MTATELCRNKEIRSAATFYFTPDGTGIWRWDNRFYNDKEFKETFPTNPLNVKPDSLKGESSDKTKLWMS